MPLQIIGAGLPRTGTLSLKTALEELGYPTYHMVECMKHSDARTWLNITKENYGRDYDDWETVFSPKGREPYTASVDAPGCVFYMQMLKKYPDAKVILSVRDSPRVWMESAKETVALKGLAQQVFVTITSLMGAPFKKMVDAVFLKHPDCANGSLDKIPEDGGKAAEEFYSNWVAEVKRSVPANKLLVFNVKEGWEPLCKFLGKPVPSKPFPRVNDRAEFKRRVNTIVYSMIATTGLTVVGISFAAKYLIENGPQLIEMSRKLMN